MALTMLSSSQVYKNPHSIVTTEDHLIKTETMGREVTRAARVFSQLRS